MFPPVNYIDSTYLSKLIHAHYLLVKDKIGVKLI
jgi:hypothetical protein